MTNRIAIFGLTGDPFTVAHREICKQVMCHQLVDELHVIPTIVDYYRKDKEKWLGEFEKKKCMRELLWSLGPVYGGRWILDTCEFELKKLCQYTDEIIQKDGAEGKGLVDEMVGTRRFIHTVLDYRMHHIGQSKPILVLGTDSALNFQKCYRWEAILQNVAEILVVTGRNGCSLDFEECFTSKYAYKVWPIELNKAELLDVSATKIRRKYRTMPDGLETYLRDVRAYDEGEKSLEELGWV